MAAFERIRPALLLDPMALAKRGQKVQSALEWAESRVQNGPELISTTRNPDSVRQIQERLGQERAGQLVEKAHAVIAKRLVAAGVRKRVVAGGETSGSVVQALGLRALRMGPQIAPGVPWTIGAEAVSGDPMALALKSGNFGEPDFFLKALAMLQ